MKYKSLLYLSIFFFIFALTYEKLDLTTYYAVNTIKNNNWKDLLDTVVECPNRGVMKNFIIRRNSTHYWFEYQCYSTLSNDWDYGESIIKQVYSYVDNSGDSNNYNYNYDSSITNLNGYQIDCRVDYCLNYFQLYLYRGIRQDTLCHGVKTTYTSAITFSTEKKLVNKNSMDGLFDVLVGRTDEETDENVGFPLRGFKIVVESIHWSNNVNVYFQYAYSILRNMTVIRDSYKKRFEQLRNSNTQKN